MNEQFLESAEFYQKRYHNFASCLIVPSLFLLVFLVGFSMLAKKEITISSRASVEASRVLAQIQSTSNQAIIANHLAENKEVKKGDLLIQYAVEGEGAQEQKFSSQLDLLKDQKGKLETLRSSLESGRNQFTEPDSYGYEQSFKDYQNQVASMTSSVNQQNATIASQNAAASQSQAELGGVISDVDSKLNDHRNLKNAIQSGVGIDASHPLHSLYQSYRDQLSLAEDKATAQSQIVAQLDGQISQLEATAATYRVQYAGAGAQQAYASNLSSQLASLKAQYLVKVGQELTTLTQQILEAESNLKLQETVSKRGQILAEMDGLLHLNPEVQGSTLVAEGTALAQIYPKITSERKIKIVTYVSSKDVSTIKNGDKVRFITADDANKQMILTSQISSIDANATQTKQGNFFKVECEMAVSKDQAKKLRYGLEGKFVMVTGEKTYFSYYMEKFFNLG
ncbi:MULTISPECIES: competence pheromone export protein ComB [Streptococcus]|uniref:competence pheromone export protein ComB n=1 Tax=Streptococcus TaxID=1301 RepID=UPI000617C5A9|nr:MULTISPECIES: competence pheromone export protein ComB [Streptococcus]AOS70416.1 competence protein ComB [Streptococcus gordonii]MCB6407211.1 competence pheromone export protein ComB [Streptococcus gordonii]MDN5021693.1 competence pheromone export protein ComB [Streptococcus sp. SG2]RSJ33220.1 Lactococcin A secretion protein LcnD [Streptococcus gordonii]RSJ35328.1 Lactococcin A secretion protein LcnD [Streptococcus gordonii]